MGSIVAQHPEGLTTFAQLGIESVTEQISEHGVCGGKEKEREGVGESRQRKQISEHWQYIGAQSINIYKCPLSSFTNKESAQDGQCQGCDINNLPRMQLRTISLHEIVPHPFSSLQRVGRGPATQPSTFFSRFGLSFSLFLQLSLLLVLR